MDTNNNEFMLTTFDNPFNPFDDFISWWKEDIRLGYDCCGLLARESNTSPIFSDEINAKYEIQAIESIINRWPFIFKKALRSDYT